MEKRTSCVTKPLKLIAKFNTFPIKTAGGLFNRGIFNNEFGVYPGG